MDNQTPRDAVNRVSTARVGSLDDDSTAEYLLALRKAVAAWLSAIDAEIRWRRTGRP